MARVLQSGFSDWPRLKLTQTELRVNTKSGMLILLLWGIGACEADNTATACAELEASECAAHSNCAVISGLRYDADQQCQYGQAAAGCKEIGGCGDAETSASDLDGRTWRFSNTCIPAGWLAIPDTLETPDVFVWERCKTTNERKKTGTEKRGFGVPSFR